MIKLGITGGIGSGKSTISQILKMYGIPVYIADIESKRVTNSSPIIRQKLVHLFGGNIFEGELLNKKLLASYIFSNKKNLDAVNSIIHPEIEKDFKQWLIAHQDYPIVAKEAAILIESGFYTLVDKIIVVYTPLKKRIERTMARDHTTRKEVINRIQNQLSEEEKIKLSDFVIVNDGTESLISQVSTILDELKNKL